MSSIKKKQEEKNLKILRELLTFENNRYCFDCSQRGPTYVDITIGSFVCTNCGGALRKYNHRVKSISMSNFSQSEMDFIKKRGNNICKKIYYGLCESNTPPEPDIKNGMLDSHLRSKYELKKWYLEPTPELEEECLNANKLIFDKVEKGVPKTTKSYSVNSSSNIIIDPPKQMNTKTSNTPRGSRTVIDLSEDSMSHSKSSNGVFRESIDPSKLQGGSAVKLPFPTDTKSTNWLTCAESKSKTINQSPFDDDFLFQSEKTVVPNNVSAIPKSQTINFSMHPLVPTHSMTPGQHASQQEPQNRDSKSTDKYAVLAELDDMFSNIHVNKHNPNVLPTPLQSANMMASGMPTNNMGWMINNQFSDAYSNSVSNPFSPSSQQQQQQIPTFNPFMAHSDNAHLSNQMSMNWPNSIAAPVAKAPSNPFAPFQNSVKAESVKSHNPFL